MHLYLYFILLQCITLLVIQLVSMHHTQIQNKSKMTPRTNSNARGKRPDRSGPTGPRKPTSRPQLTPEEVLRRSKLSKAEKQAEAKAAWERKKAERESSWCDQPPRDYRPRSSGPSHSSTGSRFFEDEDQEEEEVKPNTGSADRFFKTDSTSKSTDKKGKNANKANRNAEEKRWKREQKFRERLDESRRKATALLALLSEGSRQQYQQWDEDCATFFSNRHANSEQFPIPTGFGSCREKVCVKGDKLGFCQHQLRELFIGSGEYKMVWLKRERLRWHPDKFPNRDEVRVLAQEMFQVIQALIDGGG